MNRLGWKLVGNPHLTASAMGLSHQIVTVLIGLILTPFLLENLGPTTFGVWALLNTLIAYESISDLGLPAAMVMLIGSTNNTQEKNSVITSGFILNTLLTIVVIVIIYAVREPIVASFLQVDGSRHSVVQTALTLTVASLAFLVAFRTLSAVLDACQRVDVRFAVEIMGALVLALVTWVAVQLGYGLVGIAFAGLVAAIVRAVLATLATLSFYRAYRVSLLNAKAVVRSLLGLGIRSQGAAIALGVTDPLLKGFATVSAGPASAGAVQIGSSISSVPNSTAHSMIGNMFPAIAAKNPNSEAEAIGAIAVSYLRFVASLVIPATAMIILLAPDLLLVWLGEVDQEIEIALRLTAVAFALRALSMIPWRVSWGTKRPQDTSLAMLLNLGVLVLGGGLLMTAGTLSLRMILLVYILSFVVSSAFLYWRMSSNVEGFWPQNAKELARAFGLIAVATVVSCTVFHLIRPSLPPTVSVLFGLGLTALAVGTTLLLNIPLDVRAAWRGHAQSWLSNPLKSGR